MLRRPPTALAISADDLAAYDLRHQARLAAHARSLAQQREQEASERVIPPELRNHAAAAPALVAPRQQPSSQRYQQHQQRQIQRQQQAADAAAARPRRLHAPGAIHTGSPGEPHDDHDDDDDGTAGMGMSMGMSLEGPAPARSIPGTTMPAPRRRRTSEAASLSGEDNNIHSSGNGVEGDIGDQAERVPSEHGANAGGRADTQPGRANRAVRADAERRRLLERERILGRGNNDGGGGDGARRQHQGGSGVVGERAPRR